MTGSARPDRPRILVAEDNPINQEVIVEQLLLLGEVADVASDGRHALDGWRRHRHRLVLTDLQMPHMDGHQLARAIRADEAAQGLPRTAIVALTARASRDTAASQGDAMDDCVSKPIPLDALREVLTRWLPPVVAGPVAVPRPVPVGEGLPAAEPVLDEQALRQYVGDDRATVRQFQHDFLQRLSASGAELAAAWQAGDAALLGRLAHRLKSAARTVGALQLAGACDDLEGAVQAQVPAAVALRWAEVHRALADADAALRVVLQRSDPTAG